MRAGEGAITLALVGHIDEIGVAVTNVEENGLLAFRTVGGIAPETLVGQRIELLTKNGPIPGAIGRKRIPPEQIRDRPRLELADLHVEIGAASREDAEGLVRVGDVAVWNGAPVELPNGRLMSRALDNRLGAYVALEAARRIAEAKEAEVDVVAVAAVQEEIGLVRRARRCLRPRPAGGARDRRHAGDRLPGWRSEARRPHRARDGRDDRPRPDDEQAGRRAARERLRRRSRSRMRSRSTRAPRRPMPTSST